MEAPAALLPWNNPSTDWETGGTTEPVWNCGEALSDKVTMYRTTRRHVQNYRNLDHRRLNGLQQMCCRLRTELQCTSAEVLINVVWQPLDDASGTNLAALNIHTFSARLGTTVDVLI